MLCRNALRCLLLFAFFFPFALSAQVTTSSLSGTVTTSQNEALVGASVKAVHVPTQTVYMGITRKGGLFTLPDMQPGGPYTIEVTYTGYQAQKKTDLFLNLGENQKLEFRLPAGSESMTEVVVATRRSVSKASGGSETNISAEKITNLPSVNRNLYDYLRFTPQATVDGNGGVSIGGMNNRYNSLMIDGAVNNDVFGLSAQGTNGGQTGISPISIDAIEQISVATSPFDVSQGNFTGGAINAITRRGTNNFHGSAYYFFKNQDLAGKDPDPASPHEKLQDFSSRTFGFRLGGPLVKNKLFFFINAEKQKDETPQFFGFSQYDGNATREGVDSLRQRLINNYGYDPGDYENSPYQLNADKIVARIDWNASSKHKLSFSHRYSYGEAINSGKQLSSARSLKFSNSGIYFPSITNSTSLEFNSRFTNKLNNKLILGLTRVNDDRDPMGDPFPYVSISDGAGSISFGSEQYSTGNQLKQQNLTLFDELKIFSGKHNYSFGIDGELSKSYNLFIRQNYGVYNYNSLADFMNDATPGKYSRSYSLVDNKTGDGSAAAADFRVGRISFFGQDKLAVNNNLTINYGVRIDHWDFITASFEDTFFNRVAAPFLSGYYDLHGARSGKMPSKIWTLNPRIGFTYNTPKKDLTLRGGIGLFSGRVPLVWPGGIYTNSGVIIGGVSVNNPAIGFNSDINDQYSAGDFGYTEKVPSGEIDVVAENFKLPQVLKSVIGVDKQLPWGIKGTAELSFNKFMQEIDYKRIDLVPPTETSDGPGSRTIYTDGKFSYFNAVKNPYTYIMLLGNAEGKKGYSYNLLLSFDKRMKNGWSANLSWSYGDSKALNNGLSSQNLSQWRYVEAVNGRNNLSLTRSTFAQGHRISFYVTKKFEEGKFGATTVSAYYNGSQGQSFSYLYNRSMVQDYSFYDSYDLIYVPQNSNEMVFGVSQGSGFRLATATESADQWNALNAYITSNKYLNSRRGDFAERNGSRAPWSHIVDLKLQQDFYIKAGSKRHEITVSYDIFNFTNLLNKDWGRNYYVPYNDYSLITFLGYRSPATGDYTPVYNFKTPKNKPWVINDVPYYNASRWTSQLGLRYTF